MVKVGTDVHKHTHCAVAVDALGRELGQLTVRATDAGHRQLLRWARKHSSGKTNRHRLARGGNRQLNTALHRIAVTQARLPGLGQEYYQRRRANGDTKQVALRALKRRLARVVFNLLRPDQAAPGTCIPAAA